MISPSVPDLPEDVFRPWKEVIGFFAFASGFFPCLSIALANVALAGFVLTASAFFIAKRRLPRIFSTPFDVPLLCFLAVWLLSALFGHHPADSLKSLPAKFYPLIFFALAWFFDGRFAGRAFRGYLWGAGVAVVYGVAQYGVFGILYNGAIPSWMDGWSPRMVRYFTLTPHEQLRVHGSLHVMTYAEVLLPALFYHTIVGLGDDRRQTKHAVVMAFLTGLALLLTRQRGPWLGALSGFVVLAFLHPGRRRFLWLAIPLVMVMTGVPRVRQEAATFRRLWETGSAQHRLALWESALYIGRRHPWLGVGPRQIKPTVEVYKQNPDFPPNPYGQEGDIHNAFLQTLAESGTMGLLCFLWVLFSPLRMFRRFHGDSLGGQGPPGAGPVLGIFLPVIVISTAVINLTECAFFDGEVIFVYWILMAWVMGFFREVSPFNIAEANKLK